MGDEEVSIVKHNPNVTANALAIVGGALYLICALWTLTSRSSFMGVMNTWAHGIDVSALPAKTPSFGNLAAGLVTFVVVAWITGYAFAVVYNYFIEKR